MTHSPYRGSTDGPEVLWWDYFNKGDVIVVTNEGSLIWFIDQKVDDFTNSLLSLTDAKISSSSFSPKASWTRYTWTSLGWMTAAILRILLKQNTDTGVTSQLFSIIWWFRASIHEPNPWDPVILPIDPRGPSKPTPWPPGNLSAYPSTHWDPVGLTPWPPGTL